jgi:alpha-beta hydrolase superfamily lysophospholipase
MANLPKRSPEKDAVILAALRERPTFASAARKARISRTTLTDWRRSDPDFNAACLAAREEGIDALEDSMLDRAMKTDTTAGIFMLKSLRPHIYRERVEHTGADGAPLTIIIAERTDGPQ